MFTIGEFSRITRLSVKTLRYYHEEGLLVPDYIDGESGYRYFRHSSIDRAMVISLLRKLEFPVGGIREILASYGEDIEIVDILEKQRGHLDAKSREYRMMSRSLATTIADIKRNETMAQQVQTEAYIKRLDDIIFAGYRFKGHYDEVGNAFRKVVRAAGRHIAGKAMSLYYDPDYRERDADIEGGFSVSCHISGEGINCRMIPGSQAAVIVHRGSYETLGSSYEKLFAFIRERKLTRLIPGREIYIRGPGMFFRGNPDKYCTEIQIPVQ